ncbi:homoprotocatechuate degradation operon regulator HpaR [Porticoccus sp. GXU_MW_L64]
MTDKNLRDFDHSLPMALLRAREVVMKKFLPSLQENNLSAQQWRVIRALQGVPSLEISELATSCYLLMPSLSRILQNLEGRNLVERKAVTSDLRRSAIVLTPSGHKLYDKIAPVSNERYQFISERFGPGKLNLLYELLEDLVEKLDTKERE